MKQTLDYFWTLRPEAGIAREATLYRPDTDRSPLWVLAVDIGQADFSGRRRTGDDYSLALVGAADIRRSGVYARAAGESVERWALKPSTVHSPIVAEPDAPVRAHWKPLPIATRCATYHGVLRRNDGSTTVVRVPASAIDYPNGEDAEEDASWDPSPSGTAAGHGLDDAVDRACKELLERDAAMRGWLEGTIPRSVDVEAVEAGNSDFARLTQVCRSLDLSFAVAYLPSPRPQVRPLMGMIVDRSRHVACAGLGLGRSDSGSATRALQEALQVRTFLTAREPGQRTAPPSIIRDDGDRARFWSSEAGVAAGLKWINSVQPATMPPKDDAEPPWASLIGEHIVVDLTLRLPAAVQSMGWAVAKVLARNLQPLRMSEEHRWSILPDVDIRVVTPHPFI